VIVPSRLLLGNTPGGGTSEARIALGGLAAAAGLYFTGQPIEAVNLAIATIVAYCGSRGLTKMGVAVSDALLRRDVAAEIQYREPGHAAGADAARREAFAAADRELEAARERHAQAYHDANVKYTSASPQH
jgi:hypothetical protein